MPLLVILECRDRDDVEDVTWIEQLAKKRDDVRASRAVAVSSTGFTGPAIAKAQHEGIEIRTIEDLTPANLQHWFIAEKITGFDMRSEIVRFVFTISAPPPEITDAVRAQLDAWFSSPTAAAEKVLYLPPPFDRWDSANDVWRLHGADRMFAVFDSSVPNDGSRVLNHVTLNFQPNVRYCLRIGEQLVPVESMNVQLLCWKERREDRLSRTYRYASPEGLDVQNAEYEMPVDGKVFKPTLHRNPAAEQLAVTLRRVEPEEPKT